MWSGWTEAGGMGSWRATTNERLLGGGATTITGPAACYYYRARCLHAQLGRFCSRDPVYGNDNPYRYVRNNPPRLVDPFGLWGQDIHQLATTNWATIYFAQTAAVWVGNGDEAVDHGPTNPVTGDWSYHFDIPTPPINVLRPFYAGDSRGRRFGEYRAESLQAVNRSNCPRAFEMLGRALHSLQDYYAHGNWEPSRTGLWWARTHGVHPGWYDDFTRSGTTRFLVPIRDWDDRNSTGVANLARRNMTPQHTHYAIERWIADIDGHHAIVSAGFAFSIELGDAGDRQLHLQVTSQFRRLP